MQFVSKEWPCFSIKMCTNECRFICQHSLFRLGPKAIALLHAEVLVRWQILWRILWCSFQTKAEHRWFESCLVQQGLTEIWTILWAGWLCPSWSTDHLGYNQRAAFLHAPLTITTVFSWHGQLPAPSDRENLIAPLEGFFHQCRLWLQKRKLHYLWSALDWLLQYIALSQSLTFKTRVFVYFVQSLCSLQGLY